ncbi:hypothetical protein FN846DRAFT_931262 [Sphaerosporella brunnea]|uniref:Uncharacterized protein n=1 Tax=Sphaerosporella brunnea TaxID=1250544 RepID=A0A5J5F814_9PEZI|nr:hypothetical protein FN846DRAFT_931262 [Sphaerosporella brunnea]
MNSRQVVSVNSLKNRSTEYMGCSRSVCSCLYIHSASARVSDIARQANSTSHSVRSISRGSTSERFESSGTTPSSARRMSLIRNHSCALCNCSPSIPRKGFLGSVIGKRLARWISAHSRFPVVSVRLRLWMSSMSQWTLGSGLPAMGRSQARQGRRGSSSAGLRGIIGPSLMSIILDASFHSSSSHSCSSRSPGRPFDMFK